MPLNPFQNFISQLAPIFMDDIDTDKIIPARFLTATTRDGFGQNLFIDLRKDKEGNMDPDFILNKPEHKDAKILLAHDNFGCGSSREHAPWAILGYGFRAVIAISFADIFKNNACKNGLLPIELPREVVDKMHDVVSKDPKVIAEIDLEHQIVRFEGEEYGFDINPYSKKCMLEGLDDIGYTLSHESEIEAYEDKHGMQSGGIL